MKSFGIDVSLYQKGFDFARAKKEGVEFVIIKCSENNFTDPQFEAHYAAAKKVGLHIGAYHYLRATTKAGAITEAKYAANGPLKGKQFDYPIFVDVEEPSLKIGKAKLTEIVKAFCDTLEAAGYWAGFYTNLDWYRNNLDGPALAARYSFWCAAWMNECPCEDAQMWQFGGSVNALRSNTVAGVVCDQDYCFKDYPTQIKTKGLNGYKAAAKTTTVKASTTTVVKPKATSNTSATTAKKASSKPSSPAFAKGDTVKLSRNATIYGETRRFADFVYSSTLYVRNIDGSKITISTLKEGDIIGIVDAKYLTKVSSAPAASTSSELKVGDKVRMTRGAPVYGSSRTFYDFVYNSVLYVRAISGNAISVSTLQTGAITGVVDIKYLKKI